MAPAVRRLMILSSCPWRCNDGCPKTPPTIKHPLQLNIQLIKKDVYKRQYLALLNIEIEVIQRQQFSIALDQVLNFYQSHGMCLLYCLYALIIACVPAGQVVPAVNSPG